MYTRSSGKENEDINKIKPIKSKPLSNRYNIAEENTLRRICLEEQKICTKYTQSAYNRDINPQVLANWFGGEPEEKVTVKEYIPADSSQMTRNTPIKKKPSYNTTIKTTPSSKYTPIKCNIQVGNECRAMANTSVKKVRPYLSKRGCSNLSRYNNSNACNKECKAFNYMLGCIDLAKDTPTLN
jgi:hypothetical protein